MLREAFGPVPKEIFTTQIQPRHTKRRIRLTDAELRLLDQVAMTDDDARHQTAAGALIQ